jgi:hypothetical protein
MSDYEHDIFVSYRRWDGDWVRWTQNSFVRPLRSLLMPTSGNVRVFVDVQIDAGSSWPATLGKELGHSRLLIALFCRDYFRSEWCTREISEMYRREREVGFRTTQKPEGLIIPVVIDDGTGYPVEAQAIQAIDIHLFANPFIREDSPKQEMFTEQLREFLCPTIERALSRVPPFDPKWVGRAASEFTELFSIHTKAQTTLPRLEPPSIFHE